MKIELQLLHSGRGWYWTMVAESQRMPQTTRVEACRKLGEFIFRIQTGHFKLVEHDLEGNISQGQHELLGGTKLLFATLKESQRRELRRRIQKIRKRKPKVVVKRKAKKVVKKKKVAPKKSKINKTAVRRVVRIIR